MNSTQDLLQLFRRYPSKELFEKVARAFGGTDFETQFTFNAYDMKNLHTLEELQQILPLLEEVYLDCKKKLYLQADTWTTKNGINILRHFCRLKEAQLSYQEKLRGGVKFIQYTVYPRLADDSLPVRVSFD